MKRKNYAKMNRFGERMKLAMSMAEISNAELSRRINVDASLISRYRSGSRKFDPESDVAEKIGSILFSRISRAGRTDVLSDLIGVTPEKLSGEIIIKWIFSSDSEDDSSIDKLFRAFDSFSPDTGMQIPCAEDVVPPSVLKDSRILYNGYEGLQEAVLRFLYNVAKEGNREILLYSDQNMDWMTEDEEFRIKWASLMVECIRRGTKICIIHNIDRSLSEMNKAIISWLPLYMSGKIESYYCKKSVGERFKSTLFLCPGMFCIEGFHVTGTERNGIYRFISSPEEMSVREMNMDRLFSMSSPLVKIIPEEKPDTGDPDPAFKNISINVTKDEVRVGRLTAPFFSIIFTHPLMIRSFAAYVEGRP